jgi:hypothetical protein
MKRPVIKYEHEGQYVVWDASTNRYWIFREEVAELSDADYRRYLWALHQAWRYAQESQRPTIGYPPITRPERMRYAAR